MKKHWELEGIVQRKAGYVAAKKIKLTEQNKQSRLLFALNYGFQEIQFWENMVFSDEKMFQSTNDGYVRVYQPRG
jgi:ABC-type branched-subunit amino acid transport system ATPase component